MKKILLLGIVLIVPFIGKSQELIANSGTVTQNFNGIGGTATATLPSNWKVDNIAGSVRTLGTFSGAVSATERVDGVSIATNASAGIYNFGIAPDETTSTDRSIGFLATGSATKSGNIYLRLQNSGTSSIASFSISYNVEKYRNGSNAAGYTFQLYYSTDGNNWTSAGSNFATNFSPDADNTGTATPPISSTAVSSSINLGSSIPQNGDFYLAWNYSTTSTSTTTNSQGLGIDDISITANFTLPIALTSFTAKAVDKTILLNWVTASEKNNKSFEIFKSYNGKSFTSIGFLNGAGNSDTEKTYAFVDENPYAGANYYQLKQIDFDDKSAVSDVVSAIAKIEEVKLSVYASSSSVSVNINSPNQTKGILNLFDINGKKLATQTVDLTKGFNEINFAQSLNTGTYFINLSADGKTTSLKFIK